MFHSILITGATSPDRLAKAQQLTNQSLQPQPDVLLLTADTSITIKQIRSLEIFLAKKPYQLNQKTVLIDPADKLTLPAQHALLKTLEEPPAHSQIILLTQNQHQLLPTIVSRCQLINLASKHQLAPAETTAQLHLFQQICQANAGERINLANQLSTGRQPVVNLVLQQTSFLRQQLLNQPNQSLAKTIRHLLQAQQYLTANLNPKLCLQHLFLSYPNL